MDAGSDSSRCEQESLTSTDSLQMITDEFRLHHLSTPDVTNSELLKRIAVLELDNERLRIDLENARIELDAKNAANQGLKNKIAQLYMEAQTSLQERQKLENSVKDAQCCLVSAENSAKWYQGQMHEIQSSKKTLQVEIDTYQNMLRQKHQTLVNITAKWKQLNEDYSNVIQKHKSEKDALQIEIRSLKEKDNKVTNPLTVQPTVPAAAYEEVSSRLETTEEELRDARAEVRALSQRLASTESERITAEAAYGRQCYLLSANEEALQRCQNESAKFADESHRLSVELQKLRAENETLQLSFLASRQEREQVEDAIGQLRSQLTKMIAQHRLLKSRNAELEEKVGSLQKVHEENRRLKSLSHSANAALLRRLKQERRRSSCLQKQLTHEQAKQHTVTEKNKVDASMRDCLKQALERNKELKEQLKTVKTEESVDEGYGDGSCSSNSSSGLSLPSPRPLSPVMLSTISEVLARSKDFWKPIHTSLDELHAKIEAHTGQRIPVDCFDGPMPPSPPGNTRSVA